MFLLYECFIQITLCTWHARLWTRFTYYTASAICMIASYYAFYIGLRKENQKLTDFAHFVACTHNVWKLLKMSHFPFSTKFWPIKILTRKIGHFWHFWWPFFHSYCKRSSLRSQCWMRLFLWFSNTGRGRLSSLWG